MPSTRNSDNNTNMTVKSVSHWPYHTNAEYLLDGLSNEALSWRIKSSDVLCQIRDLECRRAALFFSSIFNALGPCRCQSCRCRRRFLSDGNITNGSANRPCTSTNFANLKESTRFLQTNLAICPNFPYVLVDICPPSTSQALHRSAFKPPSSRPRRHVFFSCS